MANSGEFRIHVESILEQNQSGYLHQCLSSADNVPLRVDMIRQIIEHSPESVVHRNAAGAYPIHLACALGALEVVEYLVNVVTTSPSFASNMGAIPLHLASYHGHVEVCKFLLTFDSTQVSVRTTDGLLPEDTAKLGGHEALVEMLAQIRLLQEERVQQDDSVVEWSLSVQHSTEAAAGTSPLSGLAKYLSPSKQSTVVDTVEGEVFVSDEHTRIESRPISASIKTKFTLPTPVQLELSITSEAPDFRPAFSVEYNQQQDVLADEFQRASLLENEGDHYHGPGAKHGNFDPPELQDSLMFNLSEEIVMVDRHASNNNNTALSALPISGTTKQQQERDAVYFKEFIEGTTVPKHSAFMFDASRKKPHTQPIHSRPTTTGKTAYNANQPLNIVSNNYEPRPTTANAAPPGTENTRLSGTVGSPKHTVFHTVPLHHEVSVPGIIITSAAVLQSSPNTKQRVIRTPATSTHRPRQNPATSADTIGPPHLNDSVSVLSIDLQGLPDMRSDITPPEQVYTLCKPLRPTSPRSPRSGGPKKPSSARIMRSPEPATTTPTTAAIRNKINKNDDREQGNMASGEPISKSLAARRLQGKASPPLRQSAAPVAVELPPVTRDKVLSIKHRWSQMRPVMLYSDELDAAGEEGSNKYSSNVTRGAFVPSKILRSKITAAELMSPSKQSKIDLTQMAQEAIRIAEDPAFTPTIQPVHYAAADGHPNSVKPQLVTAPAVPRAQMYEMFASAVATKPVHMQAPILHIIPQAVVEEAQLEQLSL